MGGGGGGGEAYSRVIDCPAALVMTGLLKLQSSFATKIPAMHAVRYIFLKCVVQHVIKHIIRSVSHIIKKDAIKQCYVPGAKLHIPAAAVMGMVTGLP